MAVAVVEAADVVEATVVDEVVAAAADEVADVAESENERKTRTRKMDRRSA